MWLALCASGCPSDVGSSAEGTEGASSTGEAVDGTSAGPTGPMATTQGSAEGSTGASTYLPDTGTSTDPATGTDGSTGDETGGPAPGTVASFFADAYVNGPPDFGPD